jgi:hypothetical protein
MQPTDRDLLDQFHGADREIVERIVERLENERPVPTLSARSEIRRRLVGVPTRPQRLWRIVAACACVGLACLGIAAIGLSASSRENATSTAVANSPMRQVMR